MPQGGETGSDPMRVGAEGPGVTTPQVILRKSVLHLSGDCYFDATRE